jgi:hypothetical protein
MDGRNPAIVYAIKPEYAYVTSKEVSPEYRKVEAPEKYLGRDVYLKRQDPFAPELVLRANEVFCTYARSASAAEAGAVFLDLYAAELKRYRADKARIENIERMAFLLRSMGKDSRPAHGGTLQ